MCIDGDYIRFVSVLHLSFNNHQHDALIALPSREAIGAGDPRIHTSLRIVIRHPQWHPAISALG